MNGASIHADGIMQVVCLNDRFRARLTSFVVLSAVFFGTHARAQQTGADALIERALESSAPPLVRQYAYQEILRLEKAQRLASLRRLVTPDDMMFRASAASYLLREGEPADVQLIALNIAGWQPHEQVVVLRTIPIINLGDKDLLDVAREVLRGALNGPLLQPIRLGPSPLSVAAMRLVYHSHARDDIALVEAVTRRHPRHHGLWMAIGMYSSGTSLKDSAESLVANSQEALEVRVAAGLTLPNETPGRRWAETEVRQFVTHYRDMKMVSADAEWNSDDKKDFSSRMRMVALVQSPDLSGGKDLLLELLSAENEVIRMVAGLTVVLRSPSDFLGLDQHRFSSSEEEKLLALVAIIHPELRDAAERADGKPLAQEIARTYENPSLSLFGIAGELVFGG